MKCSLCGFEFSAEGGSASGGNAKDSKSGCGGCFIAKGCSLVKCTNCGFEMAPEPGWAKRFKGRVKK